MPTAQLPLSLPLLLTQGIERIDRLLSSSALTYGQGRGKAMRKDRLEAVQLVAVNLLKSVCLGKDGLFVKIVKAGSAVPKTEREIAHDTGLPLRRVKRAMKELRDAGFIEVARQVRYRDAGGHGLIIAPALRRFTAQFWRLLGLSLRYAQAVKYALKRPIRLQLMLYRVTQGIDKARKLIPLGKPTTTPEHKAEVKAFSCLFGREHNGKPCDECLHGKGIGDACRRLAARTSGQGCLVPLRS